MKYAAYSEYQATGIEWLPQAPTHWQVKGLRHICRFAYGDSLASENREDGAVAVYGSNGQVGMHDTSNTLAPVIVVGRKGSFGKLNYSHEPVFAIDTTYFIDKRHCSENLDWLAYALQPLKLDEASKDSAVPGLAREDAYKHKLPVPPVDEQQTIARFLDAKTAQIDALVAHKRQLMAKLKEKRQALIARTVTRGLPPEAAKAAGLEPNPQMKDSGLEWLSQLPKHWQVLPMTKYLSDMSDYRGKTPEKTDDGVFLVTARNVRMGYIDYESFQEYVAAEDYDEIMRRGLPKLGDVLFTTEAPLGNIALVDREDIALAQRIIRFRMQRDFFDSRFTLYAMLADYFQSQLKSLSTGSTAEGLKASKLSVLRLIAPPVAEQQAIAAFLDSECGHLDGLLATTQMAIERLIEYRQSLITSAVTGKIDVRGLAPEKMEES